MNDDLIKKRLLNLEARIDRIDTIIDLVKGASLLAVFSAATLVFWRMLT